MIESGIVSLLNADPTVSSLISGHIYPVLLPENPTLPAITYRTLSAVPVYDFQGALGMVTTRIEYTVWADTYGTAKTIIDALRKVLDSYTGILPDGTAVQDIQRAGIATDAFNSDARLYGLSVDYKIIHTE